MSLGVPLLTMHIMTKNRWRQWDRARESIVEYLGAAVHDPCKASVRIEEVFHEIDADGSGHLPAKSAPMCAHTDANM